MSCTISLDRETCYHLGNSVDRSSIRYLAWGNGMTQDCYYVMDSIGAFNMTIITLDYHYSVKSCQPTPPPWGPVCVIHVTCEHLGFRHLGWVMSYWGMVFKAPMPQDLSGIKAYERLPRAGVGPKSQTQEWVWYVVRPGACTWRRWHLDRIWWLILRVPQSRTDRMCMPSHNICTCTKIFKWINHYFNSLNFVQCFIMHNAEFVS
jgi:hypothetical protein